MLENKQKVGNSLKLFPILIVADSKRFLFINDLQLIFWDHFHEGYIS